MKLLPLCAALAAGEAIAMTSGLSYRLWPFFAVVALLTALGGFARRLPGWPSAAVFFAAAALALFMSHGRETLLRESPWMRGRYMRSADRGRENVFTEIRKDFSRRAGIGLANRPAADINRAIILGEKRRLPYATRKAFAESGTMHVFAVSGFHVMIVANAILVMLCAAMFPLRVALLAAIPLLWGYVLVIGSPPSAVRAATMAAFYYSAGVFYRRPDALRAWAMTFLAVHAISPGMLFDIGNILSFTVMLSILLWLRIAPARLRGIGVTFAAWAGGTPVAAAAFGQFTPGGLAANLLVMPLAAVSVTSGAIGVMSSYVSLTAASHLNNLAALASQGMAGISAAVSSLPFSCVKIPAWSIVDCSLWYLWMALLYLLLRLSAKRRLAV